MPSIFDELEEIAAKKPANGGLLGELEQIASRQSATASPEATSTFGDTVRAAGRSLVRLAGEAGRREEQAAQMESAVLPEAMTSPLVRLPRFPDLSGGPQPSDLFSTDTPALTPNQAAGVYNAAAPLAESLTTPVNLATVGALGGAGVLANAGSTGAKAVLAASGIGFGGLMAKDTVELAKQAREVLQDPDATEQQKTEAVAKPVLAGAASLAALAGAGRLTASEAVPRLNSAYPELFWRKVGLDAEQFAASYPTAVRRVAANQGTAEDVALVRRINDAAKAAGVSKGDLARGRIVAENVQWEPRVTQQVLPPSLRPDVPPGAGITFRTAESGRPVTSAAPAAPTTPSRPLALELEDIAKRAESEAKPAPAAMPTAEQEFLQRAGLAPATAAAPEAPAIIPPVPTAPPVIAAAPASNAADVQPPQSEPTQMEDALANDVQKADSTTVLPAEQFPVREARIDQIVVNKDVPQFKGAGDVQTGVVDPLQGSYQRLGTAPIVVWEKANGEQEVITGRHRFDLARRTGETTIPAQIVRESDGFTRSMALTFDAEANIRDGQGEIKDYAHYFRQNPSYTREAAQSRGLLRGAKSNSGWHLGKDAYDDLYTLYANDQIAEGKAVAIARGAPGNVPAQASGIRVAKNKSAAELELYVRNLSQLTARAGQSEQLGFEGVDNSFADFEREAAAISKVQAERINQNRELVLAAQGAARRPEAARKMGLPVDDPAALQARVAQLQTEIARFQSPDAATFNELRRAAGLPVPENIVSEASAAPVEDPNQSMLMEDRAAYAAAHARYLKLRAAEKAGQLDASGQAELDQVERSLGQDFLDFYSNDKGKASSLVDPAALQRAELQRQASARIRAADLQSQVDLFGPSTDKEGQISLFEDSTTRYLNARQVNDPVTRAAIRGLLSAVWERRLARQLELDLRTDAALANSLDPADARSSNQGAGAGQLGGAVPGESAGPARSDGLGRIAGQLPNAQLGAHAGGLQLQARLYTQTFLADGFLQHVGRIFESDAQLVSAAQVLRNRNVETFWVMPYDAAGRLLTPMALSSRLPNQVAFGPDFVGQLEAFIGKLGATSFDVLHNHPSGDPTPSNADYKTTEFLAQRFSNFRNHFIINHGTFATLPANGGGGFIRAVDQVLRQNDPTAVRQGESPFLGRQMNESSAVAIGYELQVPENNVTLFFLNSKYRIVGTGSISIADIRNRYFPQHLSQLAAGVGSSDVVAYYDGKPDIAENLWDLLEHGIFTQLIARRADGMVVSEGVNGRGSLNKTRAALRVAEDTIDSQTGGESEPVAPTHYVSQFDRTPVPQPLAQMNLVRPVEMPELVRLVKLLAGSIPKLRNLPSARGYMQAGGRGAIVLDRRIFSDSVAAQQTLAHELGHLVDYLPDQTLKRGNLLGRLASLRDYLAQSLPFSPNSTQTPLTAKERAALRRQAEQQVGGRPPKDEEADLEAWKEEVRKTYSELVQNALESRDLVVVRGRSVEGGAEVVGRGDVGTELKNLSFWWRPLAENAPQSYLDYRNSSVEIYADALSVLFNAPAEFRSRAPVAWETFFNYLDRKPEAKAELLATWDLLHQGAKAVSAQRVATLRTGFARADEILLAKAAQRDARRNSLAATIEHFKQKHFNLYAPIIDRARQARAAGRQLKWWEDPEFVFDAHPFAENVNYRFLDRLDKTVVQPLESIGIDQDTLGDYLFFNRVARESYLVDEQQAGRVVLANPGGHTAQTARRELLVMRYRLGPDRFEAMQAAARQFQTLVLEVVERGQKAGIYSEQQLELARQNSSNYAAFAVVDYLEASPHIPAGFKQQRGTLNQIANPFLATVLKMMTANKLAELNQTKRVTVQLLSRDFPDEIALAKVTRIPLANGRLMTRSKPPPAGKRELVVLDDGRPITWHVEPEVADMFEHTPPATSHAIIGATNWIFRNVFYPGFITYNPAFQLYMNPQRDLSRSYVKLPPGVSRARFVGEQLRANRAARARLRNDIQPAELQRRRTLRALAEQRPLSQAEEQELRVIDDRALVLEVLANRGISTPFESFAVNPMRDDVWGRMLADYRLTPDTGDHAVALRKWMEVVPKLGTLLDKVEFAGQVAEAMPKLGAYRILTRELGWTPAQASYFIRNHVGTPNFTKKGKWTTWDGTLFPFINIFMRGLEADVQQARGRIPGIPVKPKQQRWQYWRRMSERTLLPRLLQGLGAAGLLGAGIKKFYDGWSDYDKTNYLVLPLGLSHEGEYGYKSVGLRVPEDETARMMGGIVHQLVQMAATQDDPAAKTSLGNLVNFAGGQVPGINPVLTLADGWMQFASGLNPSDRLRGNPVLNATAYAAGGWPATSGMLAWTWDEVGGGNFIRWDRQADTWQEHLIGDLPLLSKAVKVTDAGLRERQRTLEASLDTRNAQIRRAMPDNVNRLLGEYYRLNAIRAENRSPLQASRFAELSYWHSKVWAPNYELLQNSKPDAWKAQGELIGQSSAAFQAPK